MDHYSITKEIFPMVFSFRRRENRLEEAFSDSFWVHRKQSLTGNLEQTHSPSAEPRLISHSIETTYLLKYVELRDSAKPESDWTIRQVGIYHRHNADTRQNTWFLAFPNTNSTPRSDVLHELQQLCDKNIGQSHPMSLHVHLIRARLDNWRLCISFFETKVWKMVRTPTHTAMSTNACRRIWHWPLISKKTWHFRKSTRPSRTCIISVLGLHPFVSYLRLKWNISMNCRIWTLNLIKKATVSKAKV